jgi:hypothetical protein
VSFLDKPESQIIRRLRFVFDLLFFELSFGFMPEALFLAFGFSRGLPQLMGAHLYISTTWVTPLVGPKLAAKALANQSSWLNCKPSPLRGAFATRFRVRVPAAFYGCCSEAPNFLLQSRFKYSIANFSAGITFG